ncbi:MAG: hypothetical protein KF795_15655 [Labilithrix sp.]|nr:hypothetical protein [Labilithrix sp.]
MKTIRLSAVIAVLATLVTGVLVAGCDDDLLDDATFRLWCGESLCSWQLDTGRVRQAPTWHKNDHGVELVDTPTVISQDLKKAARCLVFSTIADVAPSAQVTVGIDFTGDGVADYEERVAATGFREVKTQVTAPRTNHLPRIFISKTGTGRAVLAQMRLRVGDDCSAPPLELRDRALGDACTLGTSGECASGVCCEGVCAECCVAPQAFDVGQDGGVATPPEVRCAGDATCERRPASDTAFLFSVIPLQCDPGKKVRPAGALCLADDDCASDVCEGATAEAFDPLAPQVDGGSPPCPADFPDAGGEGCAFARVTGGRCR